MAKESVVARESSVSALNATGRSMTPTRQRNAVNVSPLNSMRAVRSGHTRQDYIELYNTQKGGVRTMFANGEISESEYNRRMADINRKLQNI